MADNDTDQADRTLPPSEKRLADARADGRIARSRHLTSFVLLAGTLAGIAAYTPQAVSGLRELLANGLTLNANDARDTAELTARLPPAADGAAATLEDLFIALTGKSDEVSDPGAP